MRDRLPLILSVTALVVAVLGSTPLGRAAADALPVPLAKRAYLADTAKNSIRLNNIRANRTPTAGMLVPLDQTGKFPASVGAIGPKGDKGDKGDKGSKGPTGSPGVSGYQIVRASTMIGPNASSSAQAHCPTGKKVIGGAANVQLLPQVIIHTNLTGDDNYDALAVNKTASPIQLNVVAICATVAP
jgi:hypothetical protein